MNAYVLCVYVWCACVHVCVRVRVTCFVVLHIDVCSVLNEQISYVGNNSSNL